MKSIDERIKSHYKSKSVLEYRIIRAQSIIVKATTKLERVKNIILNLEAKKAKEDQKKTEPVDQALTNPGAITPDQLKKAEELPEEKKESI